VEKWRSFTVKNGILNRTGEVIENYWRSGEVTNLNKDHTSYNLFLKMKRNNYRHTFIFQVTSKSDILLGLKDDL